MVAYECSVCLRAYTSVFFSIFDKKKEGRGHCRLCGIEKRLGPILDFVSEAGGQELLTSVEDTWRSFREEHNGLSSQVRGLENKLEALRAEYVTLVDSIEGRVTKAVEAAVKAAVPSGAAAGTVAPHPELPEVWEDAVEERVGDLLREGRRQAGAKRTNQPEAQREAVQEEASDPVAGTGQPDPANRELATEGTVTEAEAGRSPELDAADTPAVVEEAARPTAGSEWRPASEAGGKRRRRRQKRQRNGGGARGATASRPSGTTGRPATSQANCPGNRFPAGCDQYGFPLYEARGESESVLIGDSIVREQKSEFARRAPQIRRVICGPGKGVEWLNQQVEAFTPKDRDSAIITAVGTNDLTQKRPLELVQRYEQAIRNLRSKSDRVLVCAVLPRPRDGASPNNMVRQVNRHLKDMCGRTGAVYLDVHPHFDASPGAFRDGLHLSGWGAARFGRLVHQAVVRICRPPPGSRNSGPQSGSLGPLNDRGGHHLGRG